MAHIFRTYGSHVYPCRERCLIGSIFVLGKDCPIVATRIDEVVSCVGAEYVGPLPLTVIGGLVAGCTECVVDGIGIGRLRPVVHAYAPEQVVIIGEVIVHSPAQDPFGAGKRRGGLILDKTRTSERG